MRALLGRLKVSSKRMARSLRRAHLPVLVWLLAELGGSQMVAVGASEASKVREVPVAAVQSPSIDPTASPLAPSAQPLPAPAQPVGVPADPYAAEDVVPLGTVEIPKIGLVHPIFHGITMRNIDRGPSHWPGTALPGEAGNTVFAGHRVSMTRPFRNIDQLVPGDQVIFIVNARRSVYVVTGSSIVLPSALEIVDQTPTATGTLFACHPPGSAKYRYVVHLRLESSA